MAENWELKATVPVESNLIEAVSSNGTVAFSAGNRAYRWTAGGGKQQIAQVPVDCSIDIAGISDEDVILGTKQCWANGGTQVNDRLLAWTPDSGSNPIEPIASDIRVGAVASNGKFIGTNAKGTPYDISDDLVVTGEANVAPQTGALLIGSTPAGDGTGLDRADDGTTLVVDYTSTDYNVPPVYRRDGSTSGPYPARGSETFETVFGLTPDERVLARERGNCACEDPATDFPSMKLAVYDLGVRTEVPLSAGGMTAPTDQVFLTGGGNKAIYGVATGGGVPQGDAGIVAWSSPTEAPHVLPMFYEAYPNGRAKVTPVASSKNGAYLVLSNGEVWYDTEWELGIQPDGALKVPDQVKKYAFEQQQFYEGQIGYWQAKQKIAIGGIGPIAAFNPVVLAALAVGVVGQGTEFTVAIQNRDYWATVSLDPPDAKWRTIASPPAIHLEKLKRPKSISKKKFRKVSAFLGARLALLANQICAEDAINRGATAIANEDGAKARAQYAAGAKCSDRAAAAATKSKSLAPKAAPVIDRALLTARNLKGKKLKMTAARRKGEINWQVGQLTRLISLPPSLVSDLKAKLAKPAKGKISSIKARIVAAAKHDGGTSDGIGKVGDAFEQAAD